MKNQMFDLFHLSYIVISLSATAVIILLTKRYFKLQKQKDLILKSSAIITVLLHISPLWIDFLKEGSASVADNMIFPIYFCNITMYMLLIVAFIENKQSKLFIYLSISTAYSGIIGSIISLLYPTYYLDGNGLNFGILKSLLSHSTMLVGTLLLMTEGYFKVKRKNTYVFIFSLFSYAFVGLIVNILFNLFLLPSVNAMYLQHPPIEDVPFLNVYVIGALLTLLVLFFTVTFEGISKLKIKIRQFQTV